MPAGETGTHRTPPSPAACSDQLKAACGSAGSFKTPADCLTCTRKCDGDGDGDGKCGACDPRQRQAWCNATGGDSRRRAEEGEPPEPATLCPENQHGAARSGYSTCGKLVYRASQFEADAQIGRLLDYLDGQRLSNDTLVICEYPLLARSFAR